MSISPGAQQPLLVIQARMESRRLPGKVLTEIAGRPMLEWLIERVRGASSVSGVVVATSVRPADDAVEALASACGVAIFRGSSEDVLGRFSALAQESAADPIVRVSGDSPLLDAATVDHVVQAFMAADAAIAANHLESGWPFGVAVEVIATETLRRLGADVADPRGREHVTIHAYEHPHDYPVLRVPAPAGLRAPELRLCVDTADDLERVRGICSLFAPRTDFGLDEIIGRMRAMEAV